MFAERQRGCKGAEGRKFAHNSSNGVGEASPQLNTMMPPPPHKLVAGKSLLPVNNSSSNGGRREYWRSNFTNGRSLSPLGYDSDESCKSFGSKGKNNSSEEHGFKSKIARNEYKLHGRSVVYGRYYGSTPNVHFTSNNNNNNNNTKTSDNNTNHHQHTQSRKNNSKADTRGKHENRKPPNEIERRVYGLMERFTSRAKLFEITPYPEKLTGGVVWDDLSHSIWDVYSSKAQKAATYIKKLQLWQTVYLQIKKILHRYGLFMVGSTMSGLGTDDSDIDMCLLTKSNSSDSRVDAVTNLEQIKDALKNCDFIVDPHVIMAKVPILKFKDVKNGFEVDLNCNNAVGIRNTHLLHCYSQMDWRVRPLVIIVKLWAQANNINDAKNMTISSYSLALMVIHYLQCGVAPPVVPCLHGLFPQKFNSINEVQSINIQEDPPQFHSDNTMSLGELLIGFLQYYTLFDYSTYAISVRTGSRLPIDECRYARSLKNDPHQWKFLCIEEPFDLSNTARSVYDLVRFRRIKSVFYKSFLLLARSRDLTKILCDVKQQVNNNNQR